MTIERSSPDSLTARERAAEVADLLAHAILRLHATMPAERAFGLGFSAPKRVHTNPVQPGVR